MKEPSRPWTVEGIVDNLYARIICDRWATLDANGRVTAAALAVTTLTLSLFLDSVSESWGKRPKC